MTSLPIAPGLKQLQYDSAAPRLPQRPIIYRKIAFLTPSALDLGPISSHDLKNSIGIDEALLKEQYPFSIQAFYVADFIRQQDRATP